MTIDQNRYLPERVDTKEIGMATDKIRLNVVMLLISALSIKSQTVEAAAMVKRFLERLKSLEWYWI